MIRIRGFLGFLAAVVLMLAAAAASAAPDAGDHLDSIRWMVGKTWVADAASPNGPKTHIESTVTMAPNGRGIQFVTTFDGKPEYNGFYAYDPALKKVRFWYTSAGGELTSGVINPDGDALLLTFTITDASGALTKLRSHIKPTSATTYDWNVEMSTKSGWVEIVRLRYVAKSE